MKENPTNLERGIREWRVTAPLPPRFQEHVWQRIERTHQTGISVADALRAWLRQRLMRPAFARAYVTILLAAGLVLGFVQANQNNARLDRQLEARYVQIVDPYQRGR